MKKINILSAIFLMFINMYDTYASSWKGNTATFIAAGFERNRGCSMNDDIKKNHVRRDEVFEFISTDEKAQERLKGWHPSRGYVDAIYSPSGVISSRNPLALNFNRQSSMHIYLKNIANNTPYTVLLWDCYKQKCLAKIRSQDNITLDHDISHDKHSVDFDALQYQIVPENLVYIFNSKARLKIELLAKDSKSKLQGKSNYLHIQEEKVFLEPGKVGQALSFRASYTKSTNIQSSSLFIFQKCNDCNVKTAYHEPIVENCSQCLLCKNVQYANAEVDLTLDMREENYKDAIISMSYKMLR